MRTRMCWFAIPGSTLLAAMCVLLTGCGQAGPVVKVAAPAPSGEEPRRFGRRSRGGGGSEALRGLVRKTMRS